MLPYQQALRTSIRTKHDLDALRKSLHTTLTQGAAGTLLATLITDDAATATLSRVVGNRHDQPFKMRDIEPLVASLLGYRTYHEAAHALSSPTQLYLWHCTHTHAGGKGEFTFYCPSGYTPTTFDIVEILGVEADPQEIDGEQLTLTRDDTPVNIEDIPTPYEHLGLEAAQAGLICLDMCFPFFQAAAEPRDTLAQITPYTTRFGAPHTLARINTDPFPGALPVAGDTKTVRFRREDNFWYVRATAEQYQCPQAFFAYAMHTLLKQGLGWKLDTEEAALPEAHDTTAPYVKHLASQPGWRVIYHASARCLLLVDDEDECAGFIAFPGGRK